MTYQLLFWLLMIFVVFWNLWAHFTPPPPSTVKSNRPFIGNVLVFILLVLLGLGIYGPALHR